MKEIWRDWVMVNWGKHGEEACKIYGFVDLLLLKFLKTAASITVGFLR